MRWSLAQPACTAQLRLDTSATFTVKAGAQTYAPRPDIARYTAPVPPPVPQGTRPGIPAQPARGPLCACSIRRFAYKSARHPLRPEAEREAARGSMCGRARRPSPGVSALSGPLGLSVQLELSRAQKGLCAGSDMQTEGRPRNASLRARVPGAPGHQPG